MHRFRHCRRISRIYERLSQLIATLHILVAMFLNYLLLRVPQPDPVHLIANSSTLHVGFPNLSAKDRQAAHCYPQAPHSQQERYCRTIYCNRRQLANLCSLK